MDDEFSEFKSGDPATDIDLLDMSSWSKSSSIPGAFSSSISEGIPKVPALKKKSFLFPLDLEINTQNLLEMISTETKPTAWSLIENIEGLNTLCKKLVEDGRLEQALKCMKHAETVGEIQRVNEIKRKATDRGDYETAIQYRNLVTKLKEQLSNVEEIEEWLKDYKEQTIQSLFDVILQEMGLDVAASFKEKFVMPSVHKSIDIENAQVVMNNALQFLNLKRMLRANLEQFIVQSKTLLAKVNEEFCRAMSVFFKLKPFWNSVVADEELQVFLKGIMEVYFIAVRIKKVIVLVGLEKEFHKILAEVFLNWDEIKEFLPKGGNEGKNDANEKICGICLYSSKQLVMLCSSYFHITCINFWINRISTDPPLLLQSSTYN